MNVLRIAAILFFLLVPEVLFPQAVKKIPVAVSHEGDDQVGQSVAQALEKLLRNSPDFLLVAANTATPRIIILDQSVDALRPPLQGRASAIAYSIVYYRRGVPGVGVFLGMAVNSCSPEIIETCAKNVFPHLEQAVEFLKKHDRELWKTL